MTQEEKAKAYDEALERARKELQICGSSDCDAARQIFRFFPELKSEDERIREEIINYFQCQSRDEPTRKDIHNKWIAWLENQGEKKTTDNLSPQEAMDIAVAKCFEQDEQKPAEEYNITGIGSKNAQGKLGEMIKKLKHDNEVLEQKHSIDINKMVDDYANSSECGNEEFGKPVPCMIRAYRQGLNDAIGKVVRKPAWSEEDEAHINGIIDYLLDYKLLVYEEAMNVANGVQKELDWLKSLKQRIGE